MSVSGSWTHLIGIRWKDAQPKDPRPELGFIVTMIKHFKLSGKSFAEAIQGHAALNSLKARNVTSFTIYYGHTSIPWKRFIKVYI